MGPVHFRGLHWILGHFLDFFLGQAIYHFETQEFSSPTHQIEHKLEFKWGRYDHLKTTKQNEQKMNSRFKRISN